MAVRATARATGPDVAYVLFNAWYLLAGYAALTLSPLSDVVAGAGRGASPGSRLVAVAVRNALTCYLGYAPWHWYLYGGDKPPKIAGRKFNVRTPPPGQHARDRFWTCVGFAISALIEYAVVEATLARSSVPAQPIAPALLAVAIFSVPWFREVHFYFSHRLLHVRPLYKHIHALHHRSVNTAVWSGLAMHPVEHLLYFTCLVPYAWLTLATNGSALAALSFYYAKLHAELSPVMGHHGFEGLGGSEFHFDHHRLFNCNYGSPAVPLDAWLKTDSESQFPDDKEAKSTAE